MLLLSWIAPGGGRGIVTLDLLNCIEVRSVQSPSHPSAQDDVGTIAAIEQSAREDDQVGQWGTAGELGDMSLMQMLCPFQLLYTERSLPAVRIFSLVADVVGACCARGRACVGTGIYFVERMTVAGLAGLLARCLWIHGYRTRTWPGVRRDEEDSPGGAVVDVENGACWRVVCSRRDACLRAKASTGWEAISGVRTRCTRCKLYLRVFWGVIETVGGGRWCGRGSEMVWAGFDAEVSSVSWCMSSGIYVVCPRMFCVRMCSGFHSVRPRMFCECP